MRINSLSSRLKLLTVSIPEREFDKFAFNVSIASLILVYLEAMVLVNLNEPKIMTGIGIKANIAISGEMYRKVPPMTMTVVIVCNNLFAPVSKNFSNWFTSSFNTAINLPDDLFSKYCKSRPRTFLKASVLKLCSTSCEIFLQVTAAK